MTEALITRPATTTDRDAWNRYVDQHVDAAVYHRFEWGEIFEKVYGTPFRPLVAERHGEIVGVLPLTLLERGPLDRELVSMPYFGHAGALASDEGAWRGLVHEARRAMTSAGAKRVELRHAHAVPADGVPSRDDKVLMEMPLEATVAELEKRVGSKTRADVRRPQKEGMTAEIGGAELLGHFHDAYSAVMQQLGSPCHSAELFGEILSRFGERAFIVRVVYQGHTAGAAILVGHRDRLEVPCAGTLHTLNKLRPNMLLYWSIFTNAIERGYRTFSFGRSSVDAGTFHFKKNWGAAPRALPYHYVLPDGAEVPHAHGESRVMQLASAAWMRLPLAITRALGPVLVKRLA